VGRLEAAPLERVDDVPPGRVDAVPPQAGEELVVGTTRRPRLHAPGDRDRRPDPVLGNGRPRVGEDVRFGEPDRHRIKDLQAQFDVVLDELFGVEILGLYRV